MTIFLPDRNVVFDKQIHDSRIDGPDSPLFNFLGRAALANQLLPDFDGKIAPPLGTIGFIKGRQVGSIVVIILCYQFIRSFQLVVFFASPEVLDSTLDQVPLIDSLSPIFMKINNISFWQ